MDWKLLVTVFGTVFLAELGDKTQLATMTFACANKQPLTIFLGSALALVLSSFLGVAVGTVLQKFVPVKVLHLVAAAAFVVIGAFLFFRTLKGS